MYAQEVYDLVKRMNVAEDKIKSNSRLISYGVAGAFFGVFMAIFTSLLAVSIFRGC